MTAAIHIVAAAASHIGRVRRENQDSWSYSSEAGVFVVCDGMGGPAGGEVASRTAVEAFLEHLGAVPPTERTRASVAEAVASANRRVFSRAEMDPALEGMGTTLVALVGLGGPGLLVVHVGDSRCYLFRGGALQCLTVDHSFIAEQIRAGVLTEQEAARSPMRHVITRAIGTQPMVQPEIQAWEAEPGDVYILCSDGLTRELADAEIASVLAREAPISDRNQVLIEAALAAGGRDNITAMLVEVR